MKKAIVIGAGIAGLGASVRLAAKGYQVTVYEKNPFPGGKLCNEKFDGYRFDFGPSIFTMPQYVDDVIRVAGKNPSDYFEYKQLDPCFQYFYEDGTQITGFADTDKFAEEIAQNSKIDAPTVHKYLKKIAHIYELTDEVFVKKSLHKWRNFLSKAVLKGLVNFGKIDAFSTMDEINRKFFSKDANIVQFFNRYATYNGSSPFEAPGTLNLIQHYEINKGVFLPKNGMADISGSIYKVAKEIGVQFVLGAEVSKIVTKGKKAVGVEVNGETIEADVIVSNMDIYYVYHKLMPQAKKPTAILNQAKSGSGLVFYWGIKKSFPQMHVHNILFAGDHHKEVNTIFEDENVCEDPSIYINITAKENPSDAPEGCENWFTMVNVPNNQGQDWDEIISRTRANMIKKINRILKTDIEQYIETEDILEPRRIDKRYLAAYGAIYGNRFDSQFSAFFRHPNFSKEYKNLYFCGGTVHPGSSIPLSLMSAKIATDLIPEA